MKLDLEEGVTETTRLLKGGTAALGSGVAELPVGNILLGKDKTVTTYEAEDLTQWSAMGIYKGSIFMQRAVMRIIFLQLFTCWTVAYALYYVTSHPENYRTDAVQEIIKTITISIAFLLGLFLNQCVIRWWDTVKTMRGLTGSMRKLALACITLELPRGARETVARTCVLAARLLYHEIVFNKHMSRQKQKKVIDTGAIAGSVGIGESVNVNTYWDEAFATIRKEGQATEAEVDFLMSTPCDERSFFCWSLVSAEISRQRASLVTPDGDIDTMAYDRLTGLVQAGVCLNSQMKTLATYQLPFIYVHMLAFMVHFVNILTAIGSGVSVGLLLAKSAKSGVPLDRGELTSDMVFLIVQAFLYQSFLSIGAGLSFPVTGSAYNIPLDEIVATLEKQLHLMNALANEHTAKK